jgi:hypothetical protein
MNNISSNNESLSNVVASSPRTDYYRQFPVSAKTSPASPSPPMFHRNNENMAAASFSDRTHPFRSKTNSHINAGGGGGDTHVFNFARPSNPNNNNASVPSKPYQQNLVAGRKSPHSRNHDFLNRAMTDSAGEETLESSGRRQLSTSNNSFRYPSNSSVNSHGSQGIFR